MYDVRVLKIVAGDESHWVEQSCQCQDHRVSIFHRHYALGCFDIPQTWKGQIGWQKTVTGCTCDVRAFFVQDKESGGDEEGSSTSDNPPSGTKFESSATCASSSIFVKSENLPPKLAYKPVKVPA